MNDLRELYEEVILDHNRNPRNYPCKPEGTNCSAHGFNPLCGDEFEVHLKVDDDVVTEAGFEGSGCAISTASASLMTERLKGMKVGDIEELFNEVHDLLTDEQQAGNSSEFLGKLTVLTGVKEYPMRVKCATLAWHTMLAALHEKQDTICTE